MSENTSISQPKSLAQAAAPMSSDVSSSDSLAPISQLAAHLHWEPAAKTFVVRRSLSQRLAELERLNLDELQLKVKSVWVRCLRRTTVC